MYTNDAKTVALCNRLTVHRLLSVRTQTNYPHAAAKGMYEMLPLRR